MAKCLYLLPRSHYAMATNEKPEAATRNPQRVSRDRRLSPEEAAEYREIRRKVADELPELIERHHECMVTIDQGTDTAGECI